MKKQNNYNLAGLELLSLKDVVDTVSWGFDKKLVVCGSNQDPTSKESYKIDTSMFKDTNHFKRWHISTKYRVCNDFNGKTLKYYLDLR